MQLSSELIRRIMARSSRVVIKNRLSILSAKIEIARTRGAKIIVVLRSTAIEAPKELGFSKLRDDKTYTLSKLLALCENESGVTYINLLHYLYS
jgi:hypothetical protein